MFDIFFSPKGQPVCFLQHSLSQKQRSFIIILAHLSLAEVCQFIFFTHKIVHTVFENTDLCEEERKKSHTCRRHTMAADILAYCLYFSSIFSVGRQVSE